MRKSSSAIHGRGTAQNPAGRFESTAHDPDPEGFDVGDVGPATELIRDASRTILSRNDSPDIAFDVSVNPYRGCEHGCIYCYARPTHEYLGYSAGVDFESRILFKPDAAKLLREALAKPGWRPQVIAMSGVTDCYQPAERELRITRSCLEVMLDFRNPVGIVTKGALVCRDADLLGELAKFGAAGVSISLTSMDEELASLLEPRASRPRRRLDSIERLTAAGVPVHVSTAPLIPGLNDHEVPTLLAEAARRGARSASYVALRLPHGVADLFEQWLADHFPNRRARVMNRVRSMRGGERNDSRFGERMRGEGIFADELAALFRVARAKAGLADAPVSLSTKHFRVPGPRQGTLF